MPFPYIFPFIFPPNFPLVATADLAAMREVLAASLPDTATVQRVTRASDGAGGFAETWATVATVACRVSPAGNQPQERVIAERMTGVQLWTVTLPAETDVRAADRLIVGIRTFEVAGVLAARSWEIGRRAVCAEVL